MKGRPVRGLIGGFLLGIFLDIDLVFGGVVKLNSVVLTILPIALLVVGLLLGLWAPLGRTSPEPAPVPPANFAAHTPIESDAPETPTSGASTPEDTPPI
jgi:hypothetical protein